MFDVRNLIFNEFNAKTSYLFNCCVLKLFLDFSILFLNIRHREKYLPMIDT